MNNVNCKNCKNYKNEWCEKITDSPDPEIERDCTYFSHVTNGDKIRRMTDDDLTAVLMCPYEFTSHGCIHIEKPECTDCIGLWLESEAEE